MNSFKRLNQNPVDTHRARSTHKSNKETRQRRPRIKQRRKRNQEVTRKDETIEKAAMVAPLQPEQMPLRP